MHDESILAKTFWLVPKADVSDTDCRPFEARQGTQSGVTYNSNK